MRQNSNGGSTVGQNKNESKVRQCVKYSIQPKFGEFQNTGAEIMIHLYFRPIPIGFLENRFSRKSVFSKNRQKSQRDFRENRFSRRPIFGTTDHFSLIWTHKLAILLICICTDTKAIPPLNYSLYSLYNCSVYKVNFRIISYNCMYKLKANS